MNYKRTICIGISFLRISAFWQLYDNIVPLILKNTFALEETEEVAKEYPGYDRLAAPPRVRNAEQRSSPERGTEKSDFRACRSLLPLYVL